MRPIIAIGLLSAATLYGCSSTSSDNIISSGISADIDIETFGEGISVVEVDLDVGSGFGGTNLELSSSDRLTATSNGQTKRLIKDSNLFEISYRTEFNFDSAGTEFRVSFVRENGSSAENSIANLPNPFDVTSPTEGRTFERNELITFNWTPPAPSGNAMRIEFEARCGNGEDTYSSFISRQTTDSGNYSMNATEFLSSDDTDDDSDGCAITGIFTRYIRGELDPNYGEGGNIEGRQSRQIRFSISGS